jgi:cobalt-zinc-cadmium efflux system outer membrane protein
MCDTPRFLKLTRPRLSLAAFCLLVLCGGAFSADGQQAPTARIDLDQAIQLALAHNHALKAVRTEIPQSRAEETTAALRPNPVLSWDTQFIPLFNPSALTGDTLNNFTQFDAGISYTLERGHKRQARMRAAGDETLVTESQVNDSARTLTFNVAQLFVGVLLAKSNLQFTTQNLDDFQQTVNLSQERYKAGAISEGDLLKIKLQLLQFQMDVSAARLALVQALAGLRQLLGYDAVPAGYDVVGDLAYTPLKLNQEDLEAMALKLRPDLAAAQQGVTAAQSQYLLAKANGKRDLTTSLAYTHLGGLNNTSVFFNIEIPLFDRNQGEIARSHYAITQSQENARAATEAVMTDVANSYQALKTSEEVVSLYDSGYLRQAEDSREISKYAYQRGAASLLDFLDAERSYRSTQLAYRQALANYMLSLEQVREAAGTRNLP